MARAAKALEGVGYDIIDLNFACPAPKVLRRRRGGYLLKEPETVKQIYSRVREAVTCPVTMKLRTGFDSSRESYDNFYQIVSDASQQNIDALAIHARTVLQKFAGTVDWPLLAEIKHRFERTTLIGSGDLFEPQTIVQRLKTAKVDGILIARGAIGNPWIYKSLNAVLTGLPLPTPPTLAEQAEVILKHFEMICQIYDSIKAVRYFRKFLVHYCRLHPKRKQAQKDLLTANNKTDLLVAVKKWYGNNHSAREKQGCREC
jgi:nifR3 family TIM-barrel protein